MEVDGKKLEFMDIMAWCLIIVVAGNETTRNATTGGMLAFIQNQDQLRRLQADEALMKPAISPPRSLERAPEAHPETFKSHPRKDPHQTSGGPPK